MSAHPCFSKSILISCSVKAPRPSQRAQHQIPRSAKGGLLAAPVAPLTSSPLSRGIKVRNWRELKHLLDCHHERLVVLACTTQPVDQDDLGPLMSSLAHQFPGCLALQMNLDVDAPHLPAELSSCEVLGAMDAVSEGATVLLMHKGQLLGRQHGSSAAQLVSGLKALQETAGVAVLNTAEAQPAAERPPALSRRLKGTNGIVQLPKRLRK